MMDNFDFNHFPISYDETRGRFDYFQPCPKFKPPIDEVPGIFQLNGTYAYPFIKHDDIRKSLVPFLEPVRMDGFCPEAFKKAVEQVFQLISKDVPVCGVNSFEQSVTDLCMQTSTGFPYMKLYDCKWQALSDDMQRVRGDYTEYFHNPNKIPWCYVFPKNEVLKAKKVNNGDVRTIQMFDLPFLMFQTSLFYDQNEALLQSDLFEVGRALEYGGFTEFCDEHDGFDFYMEVDGKHFDRSICDKVMFAIAQIRARLSTNPELVHRAYWHMINTHLVDPTGKVFFKEHGNPSGSRNTIYDNCIASLIYLAYAVIRAGIDFVQYMKVNKTCILGDDLLLCMRGSYKITFEQFKKFSMELGMEYELARESADLVGHSFFGKTISISPETGTYCGIANTDKLLSKLAYLPKDILQCQSVLDGLFAQLWVDPEIRPTFRRYVDKLSMIRKYPFRLDSDAFMRNLVFGMEGRTKRF